MSKVFCLSGKLPSGAYLVLALRQAGQGHRESGAPRASCHDARLAMGLAMSFERVIGIVADAIRGADDGIRRGKQFRQPGHGFFLPAVMMNEAHAEPFGQFTVLGQQRGTAAHAQDTAALQPVFAAAAIAIACPAFLVLAWPDGEQEAFRDVSFRGDGVELFLQAFMVGKPVLQQPVLWRAWPADGIHAAAEQALLPAFSNAGRRPPGLRRSRFGCRPRNETRRSAGTVSGSRQRRCEISVNRP